MDATPLALRVECINQLALVDAYYDGKLRVRTESLQPPARPFFTCATTTSNDSESADRKNRKKRKKQQEQQKQLDELISSGKFVPLEERVVDALKRAHAIALHSDDWKMRVANENDKEWTGNSSAASSLVTTVATDAHANTSGHCISIKHKENVSIMPPHSRFVVGDVRSASDATTLGTFSLICMDPPWENKSVDRKRCYTTFHHRELLKLNLQALSSADDDGCVLAIWVTNRPLYMRFIIHELLPKWGFEYHATWYWLKVCTSGELVTPLSSSHRLPVERLIVATRAPSAQASCELLSRLGHTPKVVVSVPLRHSWKPPPECFFPNNAFTGRKLELFARELRPQWVSIGNEPLKFQMHATTTHKKGKPTGRRMTKLIKATTPTRRRRRGDNSQVARVADEDDAPPVAAVTLPATSNRNRQVPLATPEVDRPINGQQGGSSGSIYNTSATSVSMAAATTASTVGVVDIHAVDAIMVATGLLQRLDQLEADCEREALHGVDDPHLVHDFRAACAELIKRFPWLALSKEIDQRLWKSWQREVVALETNLSTTTTAATKGDSGERQLRDALYVGLRNYGELIQEMKSIRATVSSETLSASTLLVHRLSLVNAHFMYVLEAHAATQEKKTWLMPELYYETARRWCVTQGEAHYHLARIVLHQGRRGEALYHLTRSRIAETPYHIPGSLADQFVHVSTLPSSTGSVQHEQDQEQKLSPTEARWIRFDGAVLSAVAPIFGQEQEFLVQRRAPRNLTLALCEVLDAMGRDDSLVSPQSGQSNENENESLGHDDGDDDDGARAVQLVRIVCLLIACACLDSEFVASASVQDAAALPQETRDFVIVKNRRAVELVLSVANGCLHRCLVAITSPLRSAKQKEQSLQLILPAINTAWTWLRRVGWRDLVSEASRINCERLSAMVLTGIITEGFLVPHEDRTQMSTALLAEEIEVCGFPCFHHQEREAAAAAAAAIHAVDTNHTGTTESDLLQRRIGIFLSCAQDFITPQPASLLSVVEPPPPPMATTATSHGSLHQSSPSLDTLTVSDPPNNARSSLPVPTAAASTGMAPTGNKPRVKISNSKHTTTISAAPTFSLANNSAKRVVVLDAPNIAMRHGKKLRFSCRGIQLCAEYFIKRGDRVVAFLPDYCLHGDRLFRLRGQPRNERSSITPDDRVLLELMVDSGVVVPTPSMDSDDLYCIQYALRHKAFLVTNDLFRDHISATDGPLAGQGDMRTWLTAQRISYAWVDDEFLPYHNSAYEKMRSSG